ncbi:DUF2480 family protein [Roseivirga sp. BDSF3-8]|uniref:DUF2480 family protein n=1 Tax=Roseivirga sp. BDSF3-8 TaxID=3241598 RepID=UPI0035320F95
MEQKNPIVNRVASSQLITFDLEEYYPQGDRVSYDLKENLFQELILREKDFRQFIKEHDFSQYSGKHVAIHCSADAIVPTWAFMLLANRMAPYASTVVYGDLAALEQSLFQDVIQKIDFSQFQDKKVVVKGCSKLDVPSYAYVEVARRLTPYVSSLMFGEPCSTVPLYKKPRK